MKKRSIAFLLVFTMVLSLVFSVVPQRSVKAAGNVITLTQADFEEICAAYEAGNTTVTIKNISYEKKSDYEKTFSLTKPGTYKLEGDVDLFSINCHFVTNQNVSLDLNGHNLFGYLEFKGDSVSSITGSGLLCTSGKSALENRYPGSVSVVDKAKLTFNGALVCGSVEVKDSANVVVENGTFFESMLVAGAQNGKKPSLYVKKGLFQRGFYASYASVTIDDITAEQRVGIGSGATAVVNGGVFSGFRIMPNFSYDWDKYRKGENPGQVTINGGKFTEEKLDYWSGEESMRDALTYAGDLKNPSLTINGGWFGGVSENESYVDGGSAGICVFGASTDAVFNKFLGDNMCYAPSLQTEQTTRTFPDETSVNSLISQRELRVVPISSKKVTVINGNELPTFAGRSIQQINDEYKRVNELEPNDSYYEIPASAQAPYNPGKLSTETHKAVTEMINLYRWLSGAYPLSRVSTHSDNLQAGALVRCFDFNHSVSEGNKPADMSQELWNLGAAEALTPLHRGASPQGAIIGWVQDGAGFNAQQLGWEYTGHRAAVLSPRIDSVQFGYACGVANMKTTSYRDEGNIYKEAFTAFPSPGYFPSNFISPTAGGWQISMDKTRLVNLRPEQVSVKITNLNTGYSCICNTSNNTLRSSYTGLVFQGPQDVDGSYKDSYYVEITGLYDGNFNDAILKYTVHFFELQRFYSYGGGTGESTSNPTIPVYPSYPSYEYSVYQINPYTVIEIPEGGTSTVDQITGETPAVLYKTHVQTYGDESVWRANGAMSGTSGESKRLEGIYIQTTGDPYLGIQYTTHCQTYGWLPWSSNGEMSGTSGESKRLEAIMIRLTGAHADLYDVYYRVHAQSYGWLGWASDGAPAGTAGQSKRLEGIQILIVPKNSAFDANVGGISSVRPEPYLSAGGSQPVVGGADTDANNPQIPNADKTTVMYQTHVQTYGWQNWRTNGTMSGTSGESKRLEGIRIKLSNKSYSGGVQYITHVQTYGWQGDVNNPATWKRNGEMAGTSGESKRLESIQISLYGEMADHYDIYYRVHAQTFGWLGWASNGAPAGTAGYSKRLEGIEIVLVEKGGAAPGSTENAFVSK